MLHAKLSIHSSYVGHLSVPVSELWAHSFPPTSLDYGSTMKDEGEFIYRPHPDGTIASICTRCFRKVGTVACFVL
jgi:hypothetical protein